MKIVISNLYLYLTATTGLSVAALPPAWGTNELAEINRMNKVISERQNYYQISRIDRLQQVVNRLETGFVLVVILIGSTFASLPVLATRDRFSKLGFMKKIDSDEATDELQQKA
ncbi:MAG: hypothetical protein ABSH48_27830 [Verrucomicrobiota bacterium]|jgi:hypothetical protein